ncbi:hypothetical protein Tco_0709632 [Tanacetum coccineum]
MVVSLPFTVNLYHDGLFQVNPLEYVHFDSIVIDDVSFDGMSFNDFLATIRRLVLVSPTSMHYKIPSDPTTALKLPPRSCFVVDVPAFVKACYENNLLVDLFIKHNGYDIMEMIHEDLHPKKPIGHVESDSDSDGETNVPLDDVARVVEQFEHENEGNVNIPRMTTYDPWLNKLVGNSTFIGQNDNPNPNLQGRFLLEVEEPDDERLESKFKAKLDVSYSSFNPDTPWNECKPVLGIRDVSKGSKKGDGRKAVNETLSNVDKERWNKKKENEKKGSLNKITVPLGCGFRVTMA